jgi:hypothetical protein
MVLVSNYDFRFFFNSIWLELSLIVGGPLIALVKVENSEVVVVRSLLILLIVGHSVLRTIVFLI